MNNPQPTPSSETAPPIAALPTPTPEALLTEQVQALTRENATLATERDAFEKQNTKLTNQRNALQAQVAALEKNPLLFALNRMDAGSVLADAGKKLGELSKTVKRRGAKGKFTLELHIKSKANLLIVDPVIKVAAPPEESPASIFYVDDATGELSRQDPGQKKFNFSAGDRSGAGDENAYAND